MKHVLRVVIGASILAVITLLANNRDVAAVLALAVVAYLIGWFAMAAAEEKNWESDYPDPFDED